MTLTKPVSGFGMNIFDFGDTAGNSSLVVKASDGTTVYSYTETADQLSGIQTQPGYVGITGGSYTGFTVEISIDPESIDSNDPNQGNDGIAIDQIAINPIPEPSSTALLGLGGLALILRRRK